MDLNRKQYSNERSRKRVLTPSHRANAVIPEIMQAKMNGAKNSNRKRTYNKSVKQTNDNPQLDNNIRKEKITSCEITLQNVTIDVNDIIGIRDCFRYLFQMVKESKTLNTISPVETNRQTFQEVNENEVSFNDKENERSRSVESNRSDDNLLISNKYEKYEASHGDASKNKTENVKNVEDEWIPIGSGKTLIHKDKFRKVNWKSYTIATRTLLLALFPRRILATHSLTGKRSPAFQNKPAKMCLDPKIISDVIIEIQDRFNVKENLIRSIITTKCADECKMFKARQVKRRSAATVGNQMNEDKALNNDRNNQTS